MKRASVFSSSRTCGPISDFGYNPVAGQGVDSSGNCDICSSPANRGVIPFRDSNTIDKNGSSTSQTISVALSYKDMQVGESVHTWIAFHDTKHPADSVGCCREGGVRS
ncbi:MAG: hypothetical protein UT19_C0001G0094 [Candidatus Woesebacteria bacterium GW2011_GWB1_39_10b]|uniref:Uncharacterized protein n=2 Tax=Candidatus Woeseibacteriota TaxID=1752722 RepID=A0A0G0QSK5_9BACT|nr:MAG: hypothetical protein UT19_C0001G0094 [Candidatus Woesebacteria bacterium GW2011_GWB1_39_10b]KKR13360.1 MAG: hypothetical protein UT40_C0018G0005 [Candidatus Woesebacteria bacterium GW2011_GWA1_39_21b]KKS89690.1 MAG: hypothetical protein UV64_C0002G0024 [Parcubacteria group bacterium GW2011_GWC1_43_11b]